MVEDKTNVNYGKAPQQDIKNIFDKVEDSGIATKNTMSPNASANDNLYPMFRGNKAEDIGYDSVLPELSEDDHSISPSIADIERIEEQMRSDFSLAIIRLQSNREKALDSLRKLLESKGNFQPVHKFMFSDFGTALRRRRLYSLAFRFHERAKELAPDDEHILFNMARAMFDSGKVDQARNYLVQAVAMAKDFQAGTDFLNFIDGKNVKLKKAGDYKGA